jgi:laccase
LVVGVSIAGEWWHADVEAVEKQGRMLGMAPNMSDAHTINGKPGPLFPCSEKRALGMLLMMVSWTDGFLLVLLHC